MFLFGPAATPDNDGGHRPRPRRSSSATAGKILVIKKWDERKLAYEINKQKRGTYIIAYFTAPARPVAPIERDVKLSEDVLRVLITKADHLNQQEMEAVEPQPIQPREERPSWDRPPATAARATTAAARDDRGPRGDRGAAAARAATRRRRADAGAAKE